MKSFVILLIISGSLFIYSYKKDSHNEPLRLSIDQANAGNMCSAPKRTVVRFVHNELPQGADLDVIDQDNRPLFRILIPEAITAENIPGIIFLDHRVPGAWGEEDGVQWCKLRKNEWIEATFALLPRVHGTLILFRVRNLSTQVLEGVAMDICVSVSHLPCPHGAWINQQFLSVPEPPDRDSAGCFWYEKVAPQHLKAFINGSWIIAHPNPQKPSSKGVPRYQPWVYLDKPANVLAAESLNGKERLFQAWDSPCKARCAFPGNSCMHLEPLLSKQLLPGQVASIRGEISLTDASWKDISEWKAELFKNEYTSMKTVLDKH